jgi:hypothetical protein
MAYFQIFICVQSTVSDLSALKLSPRRTGSFLFWTINLNFSVMLITTFGMLGNMKVKALLAGFQNNLTLHCCFFFLLLTFGGLIVHLDMC